MKQKSLKIPVFDLEGKKVKEIETKSVLFKEASPSLMAQAVKVYLSNQRKAFPHAKTRAEVRGSGKKVWRQKHTGRARHGDRYAPIFVGGGKAHGPVGNQAHRLRLNKKMNRRALFSALSIKISEGKLMAISGLNKIEPKTKKAQMVMAKIKDLNFSLKNKYLLILPSRFSNPKIAFRNLVNVSLGNESSLNTYLILNHHYIVFSLSSLNNFLKNTKNGK